MSFNQVNNNLKPASMLGLNLAQLEKTNIIEWCPVAIAVLDLDMRYLAASRRWLTDYNISNNIIGLSHYEIFPEIPETWKNVHRRALNGEFLEQHEDKFVRADNSVHWLHWRVGPWFNQSGAIGGIILFSENIADTLAERESMEQELQASEQKISGMVESAMEGIIFTDEQQIIQLFNPAAETIFQYAKQDIVGQPLSILLPPSKRALHQRHFENFANTTENLRRHNSTPYREIIGRRRNGEEFPLEASICKFPAAKGQIFAIILCDISEKVRILQANAQQKVRLDEQKTQLEETQNRLIANQTAAAIAHEFNQPLTAISIYTNVASRLLSAETVNLESLRTIVAKIETQALRAGDVTQQLMSVLLKKDDQKELLDINLIIDDALSIIQDNTQHGATSVSKNLAPGPAWVLGNRLQIQKALLNLLTNAVQAMKNIPTDLRKITIYTKMLNNDANAAMLCVCISDTGKGMHPEELATIFQPFYSIQKNGLGVGLAVSRFIIETHGGKLWAESAAGCGASFYFTLPMQT